MTQEPSARVLAQELILQCLDAKGRTVDLRATFGYDPTDPWAVAITFGTPSEQVRWVVARDLLIRGLTDPAGEGDIRLWPSIDEFGRAAVVMELRSPGGHLVTQQQAHELYGFLTRTQELVPSGTESMDLDLLVESLVGQSEPQ